MSLFAGYHVPIAEMCYAEHSESKLETENVLIESRYNLYSIELASRIIA